MCDYNTLHQIHPVDPIEWVLCGLHDISKFVTPLPMQLQEEEIEDIGGWMGLNKW